MLYRSTSVACLTALVAALAACGGGGGDATVSTPITPAPNTLTITGTAATGLAIAGATVTGKCKVGSGTATTLANGTFTLTVTDGQLPCVLQVTNPADSTKLHTLAFGTGSTAIANITPLTEMTTARVLGNEPNVFYAAFDATVATQKVTTVNVATARTAIDLVFAGTIDTTSIGDFITTTLVAATQDSLNSGDAQDKLLDALKLKLTTAQLGTVTTALASNQTTDAIKQTVLSLTTAPSAPPVANAGTAQSVVAGSTVTLDASTSTAATGKTLTYAWTLTSKPAGSAATLAAATTAKPTFVADAAGAYVASVIVNDGTTASSAAAVTVTASVANAAPVANAGVAQNVVAGSSVTLDGSASSDANSDPLTYAWTLTSKPAGSTAALSSATSAKPTFTADVAGTYVASLTVNDGKVSSTTATVSITAAVLNVAPVANAGVAQAAYLGDLVTLDGSASSDANGDALTYTWTVQSFPSFFAPSLSGANSARPTFTARDAGTYVFSLVVNDGRVSSTASTVTVAVANGVGPTPTGSGLIVENVFNFWTLDEATLTKRFDSSCGVSMYAIDRRPDGVIIGTNYAQLYEISPISGVCSARGNTPEEIRAVAVSASGQVFGMSLSQVSRPDGSGVAHRLHKLTSSGASQAYVFLSGASSYVMSIDFGPDGQLYGLGINSSGGGWSIVRINTETGVTTVAFAMPIQPTLGDIDIDSLGVLRTMIDGKLYKFNINTGAQISSTPVPNFPLGNSFAPIVYVP